MAIKGNLEDRFAIVSSDSLENLAVKLNSMAGDVWFKVIHISGSTALLDMAIELMTPVDQELFQGESEDDVMDSALQGYDNAFKKNLIA